MSYLSHEGGKIAVLEVPRQYLLTKLVHPLHHHRIALIIPTHDVVVDGVLHPIRLKTNQPPISRTF